MSCLFYFFTVYTQTKMSGNFASTHQIQVLVSDISNRKESEATFYLSVNQQYFRTLGDLVYRIKYRNASMEYTSLYNRIKHVYRSQVSENYVIAIDCVDCMDDKTVQVVGIELVDLFTQTIFFVCRRTVEYYNPYNPREKRGALLTVRDLVNIEKKLDKGNREHGEKEEKEQETEKAEEADQSKSEEENRFKFGGGRKKRKFEGESVAAINSLIESNLRRPEKLTVRENVSLNDVLARDQEGVGFEGSSILEENAPMETDENGTAREKSKAASCIAVTEPLSLVTSTLSPFIPYWVNYEHWCFINEKIFVPGGVSSLPLPFMNCRMYSRQCALDYINAVLFKNSAAVVVRGSQIIQRLNSSFQGIAQDIIVEALHPTFRSVLDRVITNSNYVTCVQRRMICIL